jgi:hypothetical protein
MASRIEYSEKYMDDKNEYRHVILPKELAKTLPKGRLLTEAEWRGIGVQQSRGWQHYAIHRWAQDTRKGSRGFGGGGYGRDSDREGGRAG